MGVGVGVSMRRLAKARWQGLDERQGLDEKNAARRRRFHEKLGWLMGLEPTTTRITIWDSTN